MRALFVAPVLVFALSASSHLEIRCALTGLLMPDCCPESEQPLVQPHTSIGERDCCERTLVATAKIPAAGPESGLKTAPVVVGRLLASLFGDAVCSREPRDVRTCIGSSRASPPYLLTHALLI